MKEFYINHPQDLKDCYDTLKESVLPIFVYTDRAVATTEHSDEFEKRRRLMAYFHRSIVTAYADAAGLTEEQAKGELQTKFARCGEVEVDEAGQFDVMWLDEDKFRVMEQGKHYYVESIASMPNDRLSKFCNNCRDYILMQYGVHVKTFINNKIKTKKVK